MAKLRVGFLELIPRLAPFVVNNMCIWTRFESCLSLNCTKDLVIMSNKKKISVKPVAKTGLRAYKNSQIHPNIPINIIEVF